MSHRTQLSLALVIGLALGNLFSSHFWDWFHDPYLSALETQVVKCQRNLYRAKADLAE